MPITGGAYAGDAVATKISTIVPRKLFKQCDIKANPDNAGVAYIGPSTVDTDGTDAYIALSADGDWGTKVVDAEDLQADWDNLYVVATTDDSVHFVVVS